MDYAEDILRMFSKPALQDEPAPRRRKPAAAPKSILDEMLGDITSPYAPPAPEADPFPQWTGPEEFKLPEPEPAEEGLLSKIGYVLDTPGALLRGVLAGDPGTRASGQKVLKNWGLIESDENPLFSGAGAAGLAAEFALDPLNLLPGFFGLKASTAAGKAGSKVAPYLDNAALAVTDYQRARKAAKAAAARAAQEAVDGVDNIAVQAAPKAPIDDVLGQLVDDAGEAVGKEELVRRMAKVDGPAGDAAREVLANKAARGLGDEAFEVAEDAGERVRRGQEALFSVGGRYEPFAPIPFLGRLGVDLPQTTLIEGGDAAQKIQDAWRGFTNLPGIKQGGDALSKTAGIAGKAGAAINNYKDQFFRETAQGEAAAARSAEELLDEMIGPEPLFISKEKPPIGAWQGEGRATERAANGDLVDSITGEVLEEAAAAADPELARLAGEAEQLAFNKIGPGDRLGNLILKPEKASGAGAIPQVTEMPPLPPAPPFLGSNIVDELAPPDLVPPPMAKSAAAPLSVSEGLNPPHKELPPAPAFDDFTKLQKGHGVEFRPKDAVGGSRGLRNPLKGKVVNIDEASGLATIENAGDQWTVPIAKVKRQDKFVRKDLANANKRFENATVPKETRDLAADARKLHLEQTGIPDELLMRGGRVEGVQNLGMEAQSFVKEKRDELIRGLGIDDVGPAGQAKALPKILEDLLPKVEAGEIPLPNLKKVEFVGDVAPGDKLKFAGHPWEAKEFTPDGKIRLKDTELPDITVPDGLVPKDKGAPIVKAPEGALDEFMPPELRAGAAGIPDPKIAKLNKAQDLLAATEARLGVNPAGMVDEAAPPAAAVGKGAAGNAPAVGAVPGKDASLGKVDESGRARVPDGAPMKAPDEMKPVTIPPAGKTSDVDVARRSNEMMMAGDPAGARRLISEARQRTLEDLNAKVAAGKRLTPEETTKLREYTKSQKEYVAEQNLAADRTSVGKLTGEAATAASKLMPAGASPEVMRRVTNLLEKGGDEAPELLKIADKIRDKYKVMLEAEQKAGLKSTEYKGAIDYTTHISTAAGHRFFQSLKKYPKKQASVFMDLEKARIAKGLAPTPGATPSVAELEKLKAERAIVNKTHGAAPAIKGGKPVPQGLHSIGEKELLGLDDETRRFILDNDLKGEFLAFSRSIENSHPSQIARLPAYRDLTVEELNKVFAKYNGDKLPVFNINPAAQQFAREARNVRAMSGQKMLDRIGEKVGKPVNPTIADGGRPLKLDENGQEVLTQFSDGSVGLTEHNKQRIARGLDPISYDPATANAILDTHNKLQNPEEVGQLLQWYDNLTRTFKANYLRAFPSFHFRNHISNRIQSWLGDVPTTGQHHVLANKLLAGQDFKVKLGDGQTLTRDQLKAEMESVDILRGGQYEDLLEKSLDPTKEKVARSFNPFAAENVFTDNMFLRGAEKLGTIATLGPGKVLSGATDGMTKLTGEVVENTDRAGHYIYQRMQGMAPAAAAEHTNKFLFDYSKKNLNELEKNVLNRVVFFYGYTRNVIPMILEAAVTNTAKVKKLTQLGQQPGKPEHLPEYAREGLGVRTGTDSEGNATFAYGLGTPVEAGLEPLTHPLSFSLNALNPIIKTPLELGTGQDFFLQRPIETNKKAPHYVEDLPDSVKALLGVTEETTKAGKKKFEMDPYALFALGHSPLSRYSTTASKATDERKSGLEKTVNLLTGSRVVSIDEEDVKGRAQKKAIDKRKTELRKAGKNKQNSREYAELLKAEKEF